MNIDKTWLPKHYRCKHERGIEWEITESLLTKQAKIDVTCKTCPSRRTHYKPLPAGRVEALLRDRAN